MEAKSPTIFTIWTYAHGGWLNEFTSLLFAIEGKHVAFGGGEEERLSSGSSIMISSEEAEDSEKEDEFKKVFHHLK